jgi:mannosyltransferase OCH1-like enzyme
LKHWSEYKDEKDMYDFSIFTTDDDKNIDPNWLLLSNSIVIDHTSMTRVIAKNRIGTRQFANKPNDHLWALPCYNGITLEERINYIRNLENDGCIHILAVGNLNVTVNVFNRLPKDQKFVIHLIGYHDLPTGFKDALNKNITVDNHKQLDFNEIIEISKKCHCAIVDYTTNTDHATGISMSGGVPLSFTLLLPMIISKQNNEFYKFKNVIEFDANTTLQDIDIKINENNTIIDYKALDEERETLIKHADSTFKHIMCGTDVNAIASLTECKIPKKIYMTWETKDFDPEFERIINKWRENNPSYELIIFTKEERSDFIRNNFSQKVFDAYTRITPGAFKADLWRYCILYKYGGVYVDIDTLCIGKLDDIIKSNMDFVSVTDLNENPHDGKYNISNGFIAVKPEHPVLQDAINRIVDNVEKKLVPLRPLDFSGPGVFGKALNTYLGLPEESSFYGKTGFVNNSTYLLKFEPFTEYVKDPETGYVLFQNKNGNLEITHLYRRECAKIQDFVSWLTCEPNKIIADSNHIFI